MGQGIHCAVERRCPDGAWRFAGPLHLRRNYDTFRILRNPGTRGIPADRDPGSCAQDAAECVALCARLGDHDLGEHSQSWVLLAELRSDVDWEARIVMQGVIPLRAVDAEGRDYETYASWRARGGRGRPDGYCGGVSADALALDLRGPEVDREDVGDLSSPVKLIRDTTGHRLREARSVRAVDLERARRLLTDTSLMPDPGLADGVPRPRLAWALVSWEEATRERCAELYQWCVDRDREGDDGDDVRLVFGFDS